MLQELEALRDDVETLEVTIEENEEITNQILEMVLTINAKLEAIEELLLVNHVIDGCTLKALEETNFQESVYKLNQQ